MKYAVPMIKLAQLEPDPDQPRKYFDDKKLQELAKSIKEVGVHTPVSVRVHPEKSGHYMIISGERRYRAAVLLNMTEIPGIVYKDDDLDTDRIENLQLIENIQREDLNTVERAEFIDQRLKRVRSTGTEKATEKVAKELGKSVSWVSKSIQILKYDPRLRALAKEGKIKDYGILKKIQNLGERKRIEAIALIEQGEFVASEFFKRKRYDKKEEVEDVSEDIPGKNEIPESSSDSAEKIKTSENIALRLSKKEFISLIDSTDFRQIMDEENSSWRTSEMKEVRSYAKDFTKWVKSVPAQF